MTTDNDFGPLWTRLTQLSDRIFRRGFDEERILITANHEIRSLACHALDGEGRHVVVAGDKLGCWYAAELRTDEPEGTVSSFADLTPPDWNDRVIDDIAITPWGGEGRYGVVLATRGNGAWIAPLERVLEQLHPDQRALTSDELIPLPGCEERAVNQLIYDGPSRTLLAVARHGNHNELFTWSLASAQPALESREEFSFSLNALAIDKADDGNEHDQLYVATNRFELLSFTRPAPNTCFNVSAQVIEAKRQQEDVAWQGRLSPILRMRPLSDVGYSDPESGEWRRTYPHRGVFAITLRHLLLLYNPPEQPGLMWCHSRLVEGETRNLDISIFNLPEQKEDRQPYAGWHAVAVSTLEGMVRIFRPSGLRRPESGGYGLLLRGGPEMKWPTALISGYKDLHARVIPDRVYAMEALRLPEGQGSELPIIFGLGNNEVRWHCFRFRWRLREEARAVGRQLVESAPSIENLLAHLQKIALSSVYWHEGRMEIGVFDPRRDKHTLLEVIPRLWRSFKSESNWHNFYLLVWDILARRTPGYVAVEMIQALRRIQYKLPSRLTGEDLLRRQAEVEDQITRIRKFVLDLGHFSKKRIRFLELARTQDPALEDERVIYHSILLTRRHDPVFLTDFDAVKAGLLGEVLTFTPLPPGEGAGPFWDVPQPGQMRFIATNYSGELWLLDGEGRARCLIRKDPTEDLGYIRTSHVHGNDLLLSYSRGQLRRVDWRRLPATAKVVVDDGCEPQLELVGEVGRTTVQATAFASGPPGSPAGASRLLWGDLLGRIHLMGRNETLFEPEPGPDTLLPDAQAILHLAWFEAQWAEDSHPQSLVLAATADSRLLLFRWYDERPAHLEHLSSFQIATGPISALLVTGPENRHVVAARHDTAVGLKLLGNAREPRMGVVWAFRTGDTVRSVQPVTPAIAGEGKPYRVLVGSQDAHLHALDLDGRHLETYCFRQDPLRRDTNDDEGFKIGLFVTAPRRQPEDTEYVLLRVYACAFENRYMGLRLIDRPKLLRDFGQRELEKFELMDREARLTRWRAYHVDEGHLRHRFIRQSYRYPGWDPNSVMNAIDWLLEAEDTYGPTHEMTALLRRLFQTRTVGHEEFENPQGFHALLADPQLYHRAINILRECEKRWDTPNSVANRRVQLFWICSLLREIENRESLRRWLEVGEELASSESLARPESLLQHFLEQSHSLVQFETLQYVERMLFGWPGVRNTTIFQRSEARRRDLEWLLNALFSRLASHPEQVSRHEPSPVVLQIGRLLCLLVRDGHTDPLFLTFLLQRHSIDYDMYRILEDQWEAMQHTQSSDLERLPGHPDPGRIFRMAGHFDQSLANEMPIATVLEHLEELLDRPWPESTGPDAEYLEQVPRYFRALLPLLKVENLQDLQNLTSGTTWQPPPSGQDLAYCPSYSYLGRLRPLLEAVRNYYVKKYEDQWVPPVMTHMRFHDFDRVRREWKLWRSELEHLLKKIPAILARHEANLLERLLKRWETILISEEQNVNLLQDFQFTVKEHLFQDIEQSYRFDPEVVAKVREEKNLALTAFSNLFTRLLLLSEPVEAIFLYRHKDDVEQIHGLWFHSRDNITPEIRKLTTGSAQPDWMPAEWLEPAFFAQLDEVEIFAGLSDAGKRDTWSVNPIAGTPDEKGVVAYYIFAWNDKSAEGYRRFQAQQLAWAVPIQALVYRQAAVEQLELKGRVFSLIAHNLGSPVYQMRSDLQVLVDRRLEERDEIRFEKYLQLLRQARHMDGIIDSILSLSNRRIERHLKDISIAQLTHDVVRTVRREARSRNIEIEHPKPSDEVTETTHIRTDEPKVYDILLNLLNNAVKYSPLGSRIFVTVTTRSHGMEIQVRDQGAGIPSSERHRIYEPFYRGLGAQQTASGLGLGLYMAKLYTELLDGHLNHMNEPDGGSTFTLFLPDHKSEKF